MTSWPQSGRSPTRPTGQDERRALGPAFFVSGATMKLQHQTWPEVEAYLKSKSGIIIPCGSTEQHGPVGMIGTDAICAEAVAVRVGDTAKALVAPTLTLGQAQFNLGFPGTISLRAKTLMALARDVVASLAGQGFTHIYFVNGHGGNIAPLQAAFQDLYRDLGGDLRCRIRSWWDHPSVAELVVGNYGDGEGLHATPSEISITQAVLHAVGGAKRPTNIETLDTAFIRDHSGDNHFDADSHRDRFPDGRVGSNPWLATAATGEQLLAAAVEATAADYASFLTE